MTNSRAPHQDLTVKGESVERIYGHYQDRRYLVNRRYQRKLVWTLDEKIKFIDSIASGFPVPIVLLAERKLETANLFEIIDGMQRLNAIMGFLENEYAVRGKYFDLNTMAGTKLLLDSQKLTQRVPILDRDQCVRIAAYTVPLSIYEFTTGHEVDEVFRRINSGGRKLSRQELRIAGSTGHFAQAVRQVAAMVRGDVSSTDELLLNEMKKISITSRELDYGIEVDEIFWIKQGVLTKEQVRQSRDEELVADILAYMLLDEKPPSRSEYLDDYFGFTEGDAQHQRFNQIEVATQKQTGEALTSDFQRVYDQLKIILGRAGQTLGQLLFGVQTPRAPRYFQVVFLALHKLIVRENMEVKDQDQLARLMGGSGDSIHIPEGGRWGADDRERMVNATAGIFSPAFQPAKNYDPAQVRWITQIENILRQSYTEQSAYDFKQGFLRLDSSKEFDDASFDKILRTLVGISNLKRGVRGYVVIGISDSEADSKRVREIFGVEARLFESFHITGIGHEAAALDRSLDQFFHIVTAKITSSPISEPLRDYIGRNLKLVRYFEKTIVVLEAQAQQDPSSYNGRFYVRHGHELSEIPPEKYGELFRRFQAGL